MARSGRILVVDDEANARTALAELLRDEGLDVETAADAFKALGKVESFAPHVVITDLKMPGMDGMELVKRLRASEDAPAVIVMTAFGAVASAIAAMRAGAEDYLTKPLDFDELLVVMDKALANQALRRETAQLRNRVRDRVAPGNMVGSSPPMQRVVEIIDQVAPPTGVPPIPGSTLAQLERYAILETLKAAGGSTSKAAEMLGISTRTIQYRLHDYQAAPRSHVKVVQAKASDVAATGAATRDRACR